MKAQTDHSADFLFMFLPAYLMQYTEKIHL